MADVIMNFTPEDIRRQIVDRALLLTLGNKALAIIKARTLSGKFLAGSSPSADKYSTRPAPMPLGALFAPAGSGRLGVNKGRQVWKMIQSGEEDAAVFTRNKKTWIILKGGYKRLRELSGRDSSKVDLNWTGTMSRALKIVAVDVESGAVTLGFTDKRSEQIARYHHEGAGKNRIKRVFLGLSQEELAEVGNSLSVRTTG